MPRLAVLVIVGLGATALAQQKPTFQSTVRLVQTNVLVHDKNGQPVNDLTAADFKLFEDGKEQAIQLFAVERGRQTIVTSAAGPAMPSAANVFSNRLDERAAGGVTVILFDRLNSSFEDQTSARNQILKLLATTPPGDRVALYVLESDEVRILHDFTDDSSRLVRMLSRYAGAPSTDLAGSDTTVPDFVRTGDASEDAKTQAWLEETMQMVSATYLRRRVQLTTAAIEGIANHLAGIRGRKNLVWVSSAFPMVFNDELGKPQAANREINRATRAVNNANVAVYPVDVRGLIGAFANPAAASVTYSGKTAPSVFTTMATTHPNQDTMRTIAEDSGGRAYFNSNAIGEAVRRAMDDSRVSYVLGYYPSRAVGDGKFREITVKVNRSGVDVRHRKGYLALLPQVASGAKGRSALLSEVVRNPLEATNIGLSAEIQDGNLVVQVDPSALTWETRDATRESAIDVLIAQSTPDGQVYPIKETTVNLNADAERYAQMVKEGFTLTLKIALRSDAYRLHVVVGDVATLATGSLIIPAERVRAAVK